jgi:hypothetical protein
MIRDFLRPTARPAMLALAALLSCGTVLDAQDKGGTGARTPTADGVKETVPPSPSLVASKEVTEAHAAKQWAAQTSPTEIRLAWTEVPGAVAYRVLCAVGNGAPRVLSVVGGTNRAAGDPLRRLFGIVVVREPGTYRCAIESVDAGKQVISRAAFNEVVPAKAAAAVAAPARVTATETAPGEITLTWEEVPGATAYHISRSVFPNGLRPLCQFCPTGGTFVDREAEPGVRHLYAVSALSPAGESRRASSPPVTPGSGDAAGTGDASPAPDPTAKSAIQVSVVSTGGRNILLTWVSALRAPAYQILRKVGGEPAVQVATVVEGQAMRFSEQVSEAVNGVVRYAVVAVDPKGATPPSAWSNEISFEKGLTADTAGTTPAPPANRCVLEYERADNMWAREGGLGRETVSLGSGESVDFNTDWKYEKDRNDGSSYYGSHLRTARNAGARTLVLTLRTSGGRILLTLQPGNEKTVQADLDTVECR